MSIATDSCRRRFASLLVVGVALTVIGLAPSSSAEARPIGWSLQFGSVGNELVGATAASRRGEVFIAGATTAALPLNSSSGGQDAFVGKLNRNGEALWIRQFGTDVQDDATAVVAASNGDVIVAGSTFGSFLGSTSAGLGDAYVARYDKNGVQRSVTQFGSTQTDQILSMAPGPGTDLVVVGITGGQLGTDPKPGGNDVFIARLTKAGVPKWIRLLGSTLAESGADVDVASNGDIYVSGSTTGALPGYAAPLAGSDAFVARYDKNGNRLWLRAFGTATSDATSDVAVGPAGSVRVAGSTGGNLGAPFAGGSADAFVISFDKTGIQQWVRQVGTTGVDGPVAVDVLPNGATYVAMLTDASFPGNTSAGAVDNAVMMLSTTGTVQWVRQFGTSANDAPFDIVVRSSNATGDAVVVVGATFGRIFGHEAAGLMDGFVVTLSST